jgi:hypothetical protein
LIQLFIALSKEKVDESVIRMKALQILMKLISNFISPQQVNATIVKMVF